MSSDKVIHIQEELVVLFLALVQRGALDDDDIVVVHAVVILDVLVAVLFVEGIQAPVFAIDEGNDGHVGRSLKAHACSQVGDVGIADLCKKDVIGAGAQRHGLVLLQELAVCLADVVRVN